MTMIHARSPRARQALHMVQELQRCFVERLEGLDPAGALRLTPRSWLRDEGRHGGGVRLCHADGDRLQRASINVSQVQYEDDPARALRSATALSAIVHPEHPCAPSVHIHVSWTEIKDDPGYWRIMADLNPAIPDASDAERFRQALVAACGDEALFATACAQGDAYFTIPALDRRRGVMHFYLEGYRGGDEALGMARALGEAAIHAYVDIVRDVLCRVGPITLEQRQAQLRYHTLYAFQVLTLDRGTTAGLLAHAQNDIGVLGSLPARISRGLLASWLPRMPQPQHILLRSILACLPAGEADEVSLDDACKLRLAEALRQHYRQYPEALRMQAGAAVRPAPIDAHRSTGSMLESQGGR